MDVLQRKAWRRTIFGIDIGGVGVADEDRELRSTSSSGGVGPLPAAAADIGDEEDIAGELVADTGGVGLEPGG